MKARPATNATASPFVSRRVDAGKRLVSSATRTNKSVGPTASAFGKPPIATPTPRRKDATRRRTISPKPLCQRSLQRHEAFRAAFEKMKIEEAVETNRTVSKKKPIRPRTTAGSSMPPRLPSVRKSKTPSTTPRLQRRPWFPEKSPEPQFRPRKVREAATQQRFRNQAGGVPLNLSPGIGVTPRSALRFPPKSPEIQRGENPVRQRVEMRRSKKEKLYGQTPPPAEADADSVVVEDARWRAQHRYRHRQEEKHQFRLKSQQLQYQRLRQYDDHYEVDSPMAIYERVEEEDLELA